MSETRFKCLLVRKVHPGTLSFWERGGVRVFRVKASQLFFLALLTVFLTYFGLSSRIHADEPTTSTTGELGNSVPLRLRPVPNLKGKRVTVAKQLLRLREFQAAIGVFYIAPNNWRDDIKPDIVCMQTPQPNSLVPEDITVASWVFVRALDDQELIRTPNIRGLDIDIARKKLADVGLSSVDAIPMSGRSSGLIVKDQYPRAGQPVYEGTSVFLDYELKKALD